MATSAARRLSTSFYPSPLPLNFIASKLYRFLVRENPSESTRAKLGKLLHEARYELKPLLKSILLSRDFYSPKSVATKIKSPVHLFVSTYRKLGLAKIPTVPDFNLLTGRLGQSLFYPPNVAGWSGGRTWITPATLLDRGNSMRPIVFPPDPAEYGRPDRRLPSIYRKVEDRLGQGMNITNATRSGDSGASMLADADEDYNTRYGGYRGYVLAFERVKLVPRHVADFSLVSMLHAAGAETPSDAVDHLLARFLRAPLGSGQREQLVKLLEQRVGPGQLKDASTDLEYGLRSVLYVILSSPEYQLG